jgi:aspartyl-tRNA(Asn)/glutamyl-tRNA(Gln) amidotransferase subunit C
MVKITDQTVRHVSKLARLHLTEAEVEKFAKQLSSVFEYIEMLNEVDTENVEPTAQVTGLKNVLREDKVARFCDPEELLKCTPLPVQENQIRVKPVM